MTRLTVHYDGRCGLCRVLAAWVAAQRQTVPVICVPMAAGSDDLVVEADTGEYWRGDAAWLTVLWALEEYRTWSYRLARPELQPLARQAFATLSRNRSQLSSWLGLRADTDLAYKLAQVEIPPCDIR